MRRRSCAVLLLALAAATPAAAQRKLDRGIAIAADAGIRIYNLDGNTRVTGWDRDSIAVSGLAPAGFSFFLGGAGHSAKLGLERDQSVPPGQLGLLEVRVPAGAKVWIKSAEGSITVTGVSGELDLATVAGSIGVQGSLRLLTAESIDGDIELVGPSALVRAKTGGGRIELRQPAGDVSASTVSGPIVASEARVAAARLETVSGAVSYAGTLEHRGTLNVQTHGGNVDLLLPTDLGAEFDLQTIGATARVELPAKSGKPRIGKALFFLNAGGGAQVVVRTFKGGITVMGQ